MMWIEKSRVVGFVVAMTVALGATGCTRWAGDYQGTSGPPEGTSFYGGLTLSGADTALQADFARLTNFGLRPSAAVDLFIVPPCAAKLDPTGTTVTLELCPVDPTSFFLGSTVPEGSTLDLTGDATVTAADSGQVGQITLASARLHKPNTASVDVPFDLTVLPLDRGEPINPG